MKEKESRFKLPNPYTLPRGREVMTIFRVSPTKSISVHNNIAPTSMIAKGYELLTLRDKAFVSRVIARLTERRVKRDFPK